MLTVEKFIDSIQDLSADSRAVLKDHVQTDDFGATLDATCDKLFKATLQDDLPAAFNALQRKAVHLALEASGDTNAAIKVKIRHNNVTIRPHKTGTSYSALCTLVEETWPLLTAVDYTFQTDSDDEFASEEGWQLVQQDRQSDNGEIALKVCICIQPKAFPTTLNTRACTSGISFYDDTDPIPELDDEFGATNLQDDLSVLRDYSVEALMRDTTMQLLVRLESMGKLGLGKEHTNREYISPLLHAAILIACKMHPEFQGSAHRLRLLPELNVSGRHGFGPIDYIMKYRKFMIVVAEAKRDALEHAHAQHIVQIASARDTFLRQLGLAKSGCRKRPHFEAEELGTLPTDGILSNGAQWLLIRYEPQNNRLIKSSCLRLSLHLATTAEALEVEVRCLLSRLVKMVVCQMHALDSAYNNTLGVTPPEQGGLSSDSAAEALPGLDVPEDEGVT